MDMMPRGITTINNTDTIHEAAEKLMNGNFHSLPVVDKDGNAVGIVTSTDLIKYLCEQTRGWAEVKPNINCIIP